MTDGERLEEIVETAVARGRRVTKLALAVINLFR